MTPNEKAESARLLLGDPVISAAFADIRLGLVSKLEQTPMADIESQHEIALTLQLLKQLRLQIESYRQHAVIEESHRKQETFLQKMRQKLT